MQGGDQLFELQVYDLLYNFSKLLNPQTAVINWIIEFWSAIIKSHDGWNYSNAYIAFCIVL